MRRPAATKPSIVTVLPLRKAAPSSSSRFETESPLALRDEIHEMCIRDRQLAVEDLLRPEDVEVVEPDQRRDHRETPLPAVALGRVLGVELADVVGLSLIHIYVVFYGTDVTIWGNRLG